MTGQTVAIIVGEVVAIITVGLALLGSIWRMFVVFRNDMNERFDRVDADIRELRGDIKDLNTRLGRVEGKLGQLLPGEGR